MNCFQKSLERTRKNEYLSKLKKMAKQMANETGDPYVVIQKNDGSFTFIPEENFSGIISGKIVVRFPQV